MKLRRPVYPTQFQMQRWHPFQLPNERAMRWILAETILTRINSTRVNTRNAEETRANMSGTNFTNTNAKLGHRIQQAIKCNRVVYIRHRRRISQVASVVGRDFRSIDFFRIPGGSATTTQGDNLPLAQRPAALASAGHRSQPFCRHSRPQERHRC